MKSFCISDNSYFPLESIQICHTEQQQNKIETVQYNYTKPDVQLNLGGSISKAFFTLLALFLFILQGFAQTTVGWSGTTAANVQDTWTVPCGVTSVTIRMWGGGGGSGSIKSTNTNGNRSDGAAAGGGGAFSYNVINVQPGDKLYIQAGRGGAAGTADNNAGGNGGPSWVRLTSQAGATQCGANFGSGGAGGRAGTGSAAFLRQINIIPQYYHISIKYQKHKTILNHSFKLFPS